jgi:transposase InsO family protein
MPFGLKTAPATFQRAMDTLFGHNTRPDVSVYLDNITIHTKTWTQHLETIRDVITILQANGYRLNGEKCQFARKELQILGFVVDGVYKKMNLEKISAVLALTAPRNTKDVRALLGLAGFYREFICQFSEITAPMSQLLRKGVDFEWTEECESSLNALKTAMTSEPVLRHANPDYLYILYTDASTRAIGAALAQEIEGEEHPVAYASRKLNDAETRYSTYEQEMLAVVYAFKKFRRYVYGHKVTVRTDSSAVRYLFTTKEPSSRVTRWFVYLMQYDLQFVHIKGTTNLVANALSRHPTTMDTSDEDDDEVEEELEHVLLLISNAPIDEYDEELRDWIRFAETLEYPDEASPAARKKMRAMMRKFFWDGGKLFRRTAMQICHVPTLGERSELVRQAHQEFAHQGINATHARLAPFYWWPRMRDDIQAELAQCRPCQDFDRRRPTRNPLHPIIPTRLFGLWGLDFVGPLPESLDGNKYILVAIEYFSRWPIARAVPAATSTEVNRFLMEEVFTVYGRPDAILTDNGTHFTDQVLRDTCQELDVKHLFATPYHPATNGLVEKYNGTLIYGLERLSNGNLEQWDDFLPAVLWAYRTKPNDTIRATPYEVMFGVEANDANKVMRAMKVPIVRLQQIRADRRDAALTSLIAIQQQRKEKFDERHAERKLDIGDLVLKFHGPMLDKKGKLLKKWHGPYIVAKKIGHAAYQLEDEKGILR